MQPGLGREAARYVRHSVSNRSDASHPKWPSRRLKRESINPD